MEKKKNGRARSFARIVLIILLCVLLLAAVVLVGIPMIETAGTEKTRPGAEDWMKELDDSLRLNEIVIPGSHDSGTRYAQLAFITNCQSLTIEEQLNAGVRYLDIRLGFASAGDEDEAKLKLMHGFTNCRTGPMPWSDTLLLDSVLDQCFGFLTEHPTETILFMVKYEHGSEPLAEFQRALDAALRKHAELCLLTDAVPTLGQARGKLVLLRRYADEAKLGAEAGIAMGWTEQGGSEDVTKHAEMTVNDACRVWVQDRYCYGNDDKWNAFLAGLREPEISAEDVSIHFLSTKGTLAYGHPYAHAKDLNRRFSELPEKELRGWIILDFIDAGLAEHIWDANFNR